MILYAQRPDAKLFLAIPSELEDLPFYDELAEMVDEHDYTMLSRMLDTIPSLIWLLYDEDEPAGALVATIEDKPVRTIQIEAAYIRPQSRPLGIWAFGRIIEALKNSAERIKLCVEKPRAFERWGFRIRRYVMELDHGQERGSEGQGQGQA